MNMSVLIIWKCGHYRSGYYRPICPSCGETKIKWEYNSIHYDISGYPRFPPRLRKK